MTAEGTACVLLPPQEILSERSKNGGTMAAAGTQRK